jgi:nucleotide-binding universal stress UspA family protein
VTTVVVGVDGSAGSDQAVLWAANLAGRRTLTLHVVHGLRLMTPQHGITLVENGETFDAVMEHGERILRDATRLAHLVDDTLTVTTDMPVEPPVPLLTELSRTVRMIVVGHTGGGGFTGMLVGSTAAAVVSHAHCPVLVVRGRFGPAGAPEDGPVVVGVDGSPVSEQAKPGGLGCDRGRRTAGPGRAAGRLAGEVSRCRGAPRARA